MLPNDETEQDRLDMVHHLFNLTLKGELCATKLENPQNILDLGNFGHVEMVSEFNTRSRNGHWDLGNRQ